MLCWYCGKNTMEAWGKYPSWFKCTSCEATDNDNSKVGTGPSGWGGEYTCYEGRTTHHSVSATVAQKKKAREKLEREKASSS